MSRRVYKNGCLCYFSFNSPFHCFSKWNNVVHTQADAWFAFGRARTACISILITKYGIMLCIQRQTQDLHSVGARTACTSILITKYLVRNIYCYLLVMRMRTIVYIRNQKMIDNLKLQRDFHTYIKTLWSFFSQD